MDPSQLPPVCVSLLVDFWQNLTPNDSPFDRIILLDISKKIVAAFRKIRLCSLRSPVNKLIRSQVKAAKFAVRR